MIDINKNFLIYGYGLTGKSIEKYLKNKKCQFRIYDDNKNLSLINYSIDKLTLKRNIKKFNYIILSPSIKIDKNHFLYPYKKKVIIDLDFLCLDLIKPIVIGITGTEGKSTTCQYLKQTFSQKYKSIVIGNFGNTVLDKINYENYINNIDILIIELSSYQLDKIKYLKLDYAVITNIYSDHISYHGSHNNYVKAKFKILNLLKSNAKFFINSKFLNENKKFIKQKYKNKIIKVKYSYNKKKDLSSWINHQNIEMVKSISKKINSSLKVNLSTLKDLPFRNQIVKKNKNLIIYNDSKCTNLKNAVIKINYIKTNKKILILGGRPKNNSEKHIIKNTLVLVFGPFSDKILQKISFYNSKYFAFTSLSKVFDFIKFVNLIHEYEVILFSPGGDSFDLYDNYIQRGKNFNSLLRKYKF